MRKSAKDIVAALNAYTSGWVNQPSFIVVDTPRGVSIRMDKRTKAGKIFEYVEKGTPRHAIPPKNGPMTFKWGGRGSYFPATTPGSLTGGVAQSYGSFRSTYKVIDHPGIQPRNIITTLVEKQENRLLTNIEQEIGIWWKEA